MSKFKKHPGGVPPEKTRFKKGQSGNPRGRPKGSKNTKTLFAQEFASPITVQEGGRRKRIRRREALVKGIVNDALSGKDRPRDIALRMAEQIDQDDQRNDEQELKGEDEAIIQRFLERELAKLRRRNDNGDDDV